MTKHSLTTRAKFSLRSALLLAGLVSLAGAQTTPPDETVKLEAYTVTGSNIKGVDTEKSLPVIVVTADEFALLAWRTVGEGMLMIDMYEQWLERDECPGASDFGAPTEPQKERAQQWWKLRR